MNANEKAAYNAMVKKGWKVYRNGWPDFLVIKESQNKLYDIEGCAIEFKSNKTGDKLSSAQVEMHAALLKLGIPVHVMRSPAPAAIQAVERRFFNHKPMHVLVEELENVKKPRESNSKQKQGGHHHKQ